MSDTVKQAMRRATLERAAANEQMAKLLEGMTAEIERLRADLEAASPWNPMNSAPKDATPVLMVFRYDDGEVLQRVVWWEGVRTWPWRDEFTGYREQNAVAWMPLPAPPALGGEHD